ncbi:MAG: hypothetical protein KUF82_21310 [Candidatus Thiodiazotropha sp. (ex Ctena orbiculata)]|nr:hypothetical protein [Candidatus Thiodiazotropha taylori]MBV2113499.1 hypothetical protein [Candidatus Thiodiazotropha taylori]
MPVARRLPRSTREMFWAKHTVPNAQKIPRCTRAMFYAADAGLSLRMFR